MRVEHSRFDCRVFYPRQTWDFPFWKAWHDGHESFTWQAQWGVLWCFFFSRNPINVVAWCHVGFFYLQSTASAYMVIPGIGPLMIMFIGLIMWECAPCCSCRCRFSSGLRKLKPFLDVCEISREEFEQLFQEVIMIQILSTILENLTA